MIMRTERQPAELMQRYLEGIRGAVPLAETQIDVMMRLLRAADLPVRSFLDLGCGDGILTAAILFQYPNARGAMLDCAPQMIEVAQSRLGHFGYDLTFWTLDYGTPAWVEAIRPLAPFDAVVSGFSIHHQPDARKRELYQEIHDLLGPGGVFLNLEHVASATKWVSSVFDGLYIDSLHERSVRLQGGMTRDQVAQAYYNRPDKAGNILAPVETQCQWLRQIGFVDVDCYFKLFEMGVFGGRKR